MSHTPGPWEIVPGNEWPTDIGTPEGEYENGKKRYWNVASVNRWRDEWIANRRLIAAAPDLLEALQALVRGLFDGPGQSDAAMLVAKAHTAIAKATGHDMTLEQMAAALITKNPQNNPMNF